MDRNVPLLARSFLFVFSLNHSLFGSIFSVRERLQRVADKGFFKIYVVVYFGTLLIPHNCI